MVPSATPQGPGGFFRNAGLSADCDGVPNNNVRYDSPTVAGFSASWSWGEADVWGAIARYAGDFGDFKFSGAIAYIDSTDRQDAVDLVGFGGLRAQAMQSGASIFHVPTGLFIYGVYAKDFNENVSRFAGKPDGDNWYLKGGIRQKWNSLGSSVLFGEYCEDNNKQSIDQWNNGITASNLTQWGVGFQQEIDAAAMALWVVYRNYSADQTCIGKVGGAASACSTSPVGGIGKQTFEDFSLVKFGGLISF